MKRHKIIKPTPLLLIFFLSVIQVNAQKSLDKLLKKYNTDSIPYITVQQLSTTKTQPILLDAREPNEYQVSHLKNAICVGYDHFNLKETTTQLTDKTQPIVVYCSLGVRSEDVAQKLKQQGYTNVTNLYGGIFEWKNQNQKVYDSTNTETQNVHAFSKQWGKWLKKGNKIYTKTNN